MDCDSDEAGRRKRSMIGCKFSHDPEEVHVKAARKIIECLSATVHLGLTFRKDSKLTEVQLNYDLETYVDADHANKADDRRSFSVVAFCCGGTLVSWFSSRQKCVAPSATEAEYVAMADGVKEALYVRRYLVFLIPSMGSPNIGVFEDNKGVIDLAKTPVSSSDSKQSMYGTICCASGWGRETCLLSISGRTTSIGTFSQRLMAERVSRNTAISVRDTVISCLWMMSAFIEAC